MKTFGFFRTLGLVGICICLVSTEEAVSGNKDRENKPNVVFFLADDMGWIDAGCYGSKIYQTPAIDKLASNGVRFTQAYANHPMCVGSRYAIMTGKYPARGGIPGRTKYPDSMPSSEYTMAEAFKDCGYRTFFAGKWHLHSSIYPEHQGFEVNIGGHTWGAPASYFYPYGNEGNKRKVPGLDKGSKQGEYLTDRLTDETEKFIRKHQNEPFFVYLSHYAVHTPLQGKTSFVDSYTSIINSASFNGAAYLKEREADNKMHQDNPIYAAMIQSIDESLGKIMALLTELNLIENTIIVFTSDNGGESCKIEKGARSTSNHPLRAGKCWLYEGGIRVPLIVSWPGVIQSDELSKSLVIGTDHYPTLLELVGLPLVQEQHCDGISYANVLKGRYCPKRKPMFWHFPIDMSPTVQRAVGMRSGTVIRDGDYKLIDWYSTDNYELYNLRDDIEEVDDLATQEPEKAKELLARIQNWRHELNAPMLSKTPEEK
ncbi:sulfatase [Bacteroidota bacterium]